MENHNRLQISSLQTLDLRNSASWETKSCQRKTGKFKFYALTNWSAETFPKALELYEFLHWFDGRLVSGEEKTRKPFYDFYELLINKFAIDKSNAIFIDDNFRNIAAAESFGIKSFHFTSASDLEKELISIGLLT